MLLEERRAPENPRYTDNTSHSFREFTEPPEACPQQLSQEKSNKQPMVWSRTRGAQTLPLRPEGHGVPISSGRSRSVCTSCPHQPLHRARSAVSAPACGTWLLMQSPWQPCLGNKDSGPLHSRRCLAQSRPDPRPLVALCAGHRPPQDSVWTCPDRRSPSSQGERDPSASAASVLAWPLPQLQTLSLPEDLPARPKLNSSFSRPTCLFPLSLLGKWHPIHLRAQAKPQEWCPGLCPHPTPGPPARPDHPHQTRPT